MGVRKGDVGTEHTTVLVQQVGIMVCHVALQRVIIAGRIVGGHFALMQSVIGVRAVALGLGLLTVVWGFV